jgi:hypothetical protein
MTKISMAAKDAKSAKQEFGESPAKALRRKGEKRKHFSELRGFAPLRQ